MVIPMLKPLLATLALIGTTATATLATPLQPNLIRLRYQDGTTITISCTQATVSINGLPFSAYAAESVADQLCRTSVLYIPEAL